MGKCVCTELEHLTGSHAAPLMGRSVKEQFRRMLDGIAWIPTGVTRFSYHICSLRGALSLWAAYSLRPSKRSTEGRGRRRREARWKQVNARYLLYATRTKPSFPEIKTGNKEICSFSWIHKVVLQR